MSVVRPSTSSLRHFALAPAYTTRAIFDAFDTTARDLQRLCLARASSKMDSLSGSDLVALPDSINNLEADITRALAARLAAGLPYTYLGATLIAVNPYKSLPAVYAPTVLSAARAASQSTLLAPHIWAVAARALLASAHAPQSIVISGESGSGKTESCRFALQFFSGSSTAATARATKGAPTTVAARVMAATLLMEALGNASTTRNSNSSRYGKLTTLGFSAGGVLKSAELSIFLLETSRIVNRPAGEDLFHIVKYACAAPPELQAQLQLQLPTSGGYLEGTRAVSASDAASFRGLIACAKTLNIDLADLWRSIALVLHLGHVAFVDDSMPLVLERNASAAAIAKLLSCTVEALETALTTRELRIKGDAIGHQNSLREAIETRDACAKLTYAAAFDAVARLLNKATAAPDSTDAPRNISLLDVFGFEIGSSFSTLAINYTNEHLQALFVDRTLKAEIAIYEMEGVPYKSAAVADYSETISAFQGSPGIWSLLNDASKLGASDSSLAATFRSRLAKSLIVSFVSPTETHFSVAHYAATVEYDLAAMSVANADRVPTRFASLIAASPLGQQFLQTSAPAASAVFTSASIKLRASLDELKAVLGASQIHFVRALLPNLQKAPTADIAVLGSQISYACLAAAHRVAAGGYAFKAHYADFFERYKLLSAAGFSTVLNGDVEGDRTAVAALLESVHLPACNDGRGADVSKRAAELGVSFAKGKHVGDIATAGAKLSSASYVLGATRVFFKDGATLERFEFARAIALDAVVTRLQRSFRSAHALARTRATLRSFSRLRARVRGAVVRIRMRRTKRATILLQARVRGSLARIAHAAERTAIGHAEFANGKLRRALSMAWPLPPSSDYMGLSASQVAQVASLAPGASDGIAYADLVLKLRPRSVSRLFSGARVLVVTSSHIVSLDATLTHVKSMFAIDDVAGISMSPASDPLVVLRTTAARGRDFCVLSETKVALVRAISAAAARRATSSPTEPAAAPAPSAPFSTPTTPPFITISASFIAIVAPRREVAVSIEMLSRGGPAETQLAGPRAADQLIVPRVGGPARAADVLATRVVASDGGAKLRFLVADERTPRKPLHELLTDAEKAALKHKLRRGIKL